MRCDEILKSLNNSTIGDKIPGGKKSHIILQLLGVLSNILVKSVERLDEIKNGVQTVQAQRGPRNHCAKIPF